MNGIDISQHQGSIDIQTSAGATITCSDPIFSILELQRTLRMLNYGDVDLDGIDGTQTQGAVSNAQSGYGIAVDGISGNVTEFHLRGQLQSVQVRLNELGYCCTVDGRLGDSGTETINAVLDFQRDCGLTQDWIIGINTFNALFSSTPPRETLPESAPVVQLNEGMASEHFAWSEFACECPVNPNIPDPHCDGYPATEFGQIIDPVMIQNIEKLRQNIQAPVVITSGIRCPSCNNYYGGVPNSNHKFGRAIDCYSPGMSIDALAQASQDAGFTEIRKYYTKGFCHLGMTGTGIVVQEL